MNEDNVEDGTPENEEGVDQTNQEDQEGSEEEQADSGEDGQEDGEETSEDQEEGPSAFPEDLLPFATEFEEKGELSEESYTALAEKGFSKEVVDAYIEGATSTPTEADADALIEKFGGEEAFTELATWGTENLSAEDKEVYALGISNKKTAALAVEWLAMKRQLASEQAPEDEGEEAAAEDKPVKLKGTKPANTRGDVFQNREEVKKAMRDKRYGRDREYTKSVRDKVGRSSLF